MAEGGLWAATSSLPLCLGLWAAELCWVRLKLTGHLQRPWHRLCLHNSFLGRYSHAHHSGATTCFQCSTVSRTRCYLHPVDPVLTSVAFRDEAADSFHEWVGLYLYCTTLQLCEVSSTDFSRESKYYNHPSGSLNERKLLIFATLSSQMWGFAAFLWLIFASWSFGQMLRQHKNIWRGHIGLCRLRFWHFIHFTRGITHFDNWFMGWRNLEDN